MANSPSKYLQSTQAQLPASPRSPGRLRKLQSAHQLSSHYANASGPSLISQQRHQQRNASALQHPPVPPIPIQHSPQRQNRTRSNSDNGPADPTKLTNSPRKPLLPRKIPVIKDAKHELESLIRQGPKDNISLSLQNLRHWILCDGIVADPDGMSHVRIYAWLILLNATPISTDAYLELTRRGPSSAHAKICDDTFRTFKTNPLFKRRVTDNSLVRLLNATAWRLADARGQPHGTSSRLKNTSSGFGSPELQATQASADDDRETKQSDSDKAPLNPSSGVYVQGMNVLCAPFLYVARSEAEAFAAFHRFITTQCPGYVRGAMDGVHKGVALVDRCLATVDPKLSSYLLSKGVKAEIYAFASVLTMCAATPPLQEVLHVWDFLFAYGSHLNILCICAQLIMMKEDLLASTSPGMLLRAFPSLDAKKVIMLTIALVPKISDDLYHELVMHAQ